MRSSVLIVDDEPTVRKVLTQMLGESGLPALEAGDASEALNALRKDGRSVGVLVTDVRMPGFLNGIDLAKFVQHSWPWIKVIVMTGFAESVQNGLPRGARFVQKPWGTEEMMGNILQAAAEFERVQATASLH
jgi:DNA-binding NtrC family response regulator